MIKYKRIILAIVIVLMISFFIFGCVKINHKEKNTQYKESTPILNIVKNYANNIKNKNDYEDIFYEENPIFDFMEANHIYYKNYNIDYHKSFEELVIDKYVFYVPYYIINMNDKTYYFKHNNQATDFLNQINQYEDTQYQILENRNFLYKETQQAELDNVIDTKRQEYEERKAEETRQRIEALAKQVGTDVPANASEYQAYAHDLVINQYGWSEYDFQCLVNLWYRESRWDPTVHNRSSGAHGIPQALPADRMASEGADYYTNGYTQIRWGLKYIAQRYGTPAAAWEHSERVNWY